MGCQGQNSALVSMFQGWNTPVIRKGPLFDGFRCVNPLSVVPPAAWSIPAVSSSISSAVDCRFFIAVVGSVLSGLVSPKPNVSL